MSERPALADLVADPVPFLEDADPAVRRLAVATLADRLDDATGPLVIERLATEGRCGYHPRAMARQRSGSVVCPSCGRLVGVEFIKTGSETDPRPVFMGEHMHWNTEFGVWTLHAAASRGASSGIPAQRGHG